MKHQKTKVALSISRKFPPETNPTAIRSSKLLKYLPGNWQVQVITAVEEGSLDAKTTVHVVKSWFPNRLAQWIKTFKLSKFWELLVWPDDDIFWVIPAVLKGLQVVKQHQPDVIVVFLKPYSAGLAGILLKWLTGIPLVINVCEPSTCTDLYMTFPTWIHYRMDRWLEDFYVRQSDAITYASQLHVETVRSRHSLSQHAKFHLTRGGADPEDFQTPALPVCSNQSFTIVYTGGMTGWEDFVSQPETQNWLQKLQRAWYRLGRYQQVKIDSRSSSPVYIGQAVQNILDRYPEWADRIQIKVYGNKCSEAIVERVLQDYRLTPIVSVVGSIPNAEVVQVARQADLLFMALPDRPDGSAGGRMSLKTYEYLMSDRPILAAVPNGETRNYLQEKPGVWIVDPMDVESMERVIQELATAKFSGGFPQIDRSDVQREISYTQRAQEFAEILCQAGSKADPPIAIQEPQSVLKT